MNACKHRCPLFTLFCLAILATGAAGQINPDALKVETLLGSIEKQASRPDNGSEHSATITEKELNAYIAYRLASDKATVVKNLTVDLLAHDHVRGKIGFDAQRLNLDRLLGENLDFDFKGIFHTKNGSARLELISLHLGGQRVKPQVLDFVLSTAALVRHTDSASIADWYDLPRGINRVVVNKATLILHY